MPEKQVYLSLRRLGGRLRMEVTCRWCGPKGTLVWPGPGCVSCGRRRDEVNRFLESPDWKGLEASGSPESYLIALDMAEELLGERPNVAVTAETECLPPGAKQLSRQELEIYMSQVANPLKMKAEAAKTGQGGDYELPDADTHYGVLVAVIDLGTQTKVFKGESQTRRSVFFAWELTECKRRDGSNFVVGQEYNLSANPESNLRKALEAVRRKAYADGEDIALDKWPGTPWAIDITHQEKTGNDGTRKTYYKVHKVGPVKKGYEVPKAAHQPFFWFVGCEDDIPAHDWLPRNYGAKIDDLIRLSPEWQALQAGENKAGGDGPDGPSGTADDVDLPF